MNKTNANDHFGSATGTENIYSCKPFPLCYTDGVKDMVENCKAYWLIDLIISYQSDKAIAAQPFQVWELERIEADRFIIKATDGNDNPIAKQIIPYSDFPFDSAKIWISNDVLLLPCEY